MAFLGLIGKIVQIETKELFFEFTPAVSLGRKNPRTVAFPRPITMPRCAIARWPFTRMSGVFARCDAKDEERRGGDKKRRQKAFPCSFAAASADSLVSYSRQELNNFLKLAETIPVEGEGEGGRENEGDFERRRAAGQK